MMASFDRDRGDHIHFHLMQISAIRHVHAGRTLLLVRSVDQLQVAGAVISNTRRSMSATA
jgi:hypothetical protein